jgi:hypothetical protein
MDVVHRMLTNYSQDVDGWSDTTVGHFYVPLIFRFHNKSDRKRFQKQYAIDCPH